MRILVVSSFYPPFELGGWPQLTFDLNCKLQERGHEILVVTSEYRVHDLKDPETNIRRILHLESPDIDHYHPMYTFSFLRWERENREKLDKVLREFSPEVVFIHGLWNMSPDVAIHLEEICSDRVVYYMASTWPSNLDSHRGYWLSPANSRLKTAGKKAIWGLISRTVLSDHQGRKPRFARVLCVSAFIRQYLHDTLKIPWDAMEVVHNGIDASVFTPAERTNKISETPVQLLYAGGLWEHKGVTTAIDAMSLLINQMGIKDVHLTLVGAGHPEYVSLLWQKIKSGNIENYVTFGERVPRERMPALLHGYDVLLFPSTGPEALARMVQEAMACGLAVIGSDTGGTPEIVLDNQTGLLFEAGNASALAEKIALLVQDAEMCRRLGGNGRLLVEDRFTIDGMAEKVERILGEIAISSKAKISA
jgi:glycosyltransferase involved in cell wall biosynthesis